MNVRVNEINDRLYVSEYVQEPGHTHINHYEVTFQNMKILFILGFSVLFVMAAALFQFLVEKAKDEIMHRHHGTDDESVD